MQEEVIVISAISEKLAQLPRCRLAQLPTPLQEAQRLSRELGGPRIYFKRDDLTGAGLGGNKVRKLEFILGAAIEQGADTIIASGGYQSNMARIVAALAAKLSLEAHIVLGGTAEESRERRGNLLLDEIFGATIHFVETAVRWEFGDAVEQVADALQAKGKKPFIVPLGGSSPLGMAGYINATAELLQQLKLQDISAQHLVVGVGSGGTYAGLLLGALNMNAPYRVTGFSVSRTAEYLYEKLPSDADTGAQILGLEKSPTASDMHVINEYMGEGYGRVTDGCRDAIALCARTEGVLLDPVYSGKAMDGLISMIRKGAFGADETVIFLNTGGWPALFAYGAQSLPNGSSPEGANEHCD